MNDAAAPTAGPRVGFHISACGHENHYRRPLCQTCGAPNVKAPPSCDDPQEVREPFIVMEDFRTMLGNVTGVFKKGMVLTDFGQIAELRRQGGYPIVPASQSRGVACCPNCKHTFPLSAKAVSLKSAG